MRNQHEIAVIGLLPADLRKALEENFALADFPLEGPHRVALADLPRETRAVATRAVLGVPQGLLEALPRLGLVLSMGAGLERIDAAALASRNVRLVHTPDAFTEDVADFAVGQIFAAQRDLLAADRFVRSGKWDTERFRNAQRVSNRRVGIVGMGRVGTRIADKCGALGMQVRYFSRTPREDSGLTFVGDLLELASWSDILVLACPGTPETENLVGREVLEALGWEGILINVARGSVVDDHALVEALETGTIRCAALDVFRDEPRIDPRLLALENVLLSPHSASFTQEARAAVNERLVSAAREFFADRSLAVDVSAGSNTKA
jgi:lactate dehydrogenase-like 2-hydroxyacid dehydrogenase